MKYTKWSSSHSIKNKRECTNAIPVHGNWLGTIKFQEETLLIFPFLTQGHRNKGIIFRKRPITHCLADWKKKSLTGFNESTNELDCKVYRILCSSVVITVTTTTYKTQTSYSLPTSSFKSQIFLSYFNGLLVCLYISKLYDCKVHCY